MPVEMSLETTSANQRTLFTVDEFVQLVEFSYLTKSSLRHLIFNSGSRYSASGDIIKGNGLRDAGAIVRIGRKVLIDSLKFREWITSQQAKSDGATSDVCTNPSVRA